MDPIQTQDAPQSSQMVPTADPGAMPVSPVSAPGSSAGLDAQQVEHHGRLAQMLDAVGSALGGADEIHVTRDNDGKMVISKTPSTPAQKWSRIAATALQGLAAGYSVPNGPGNIGRAAAAGVGAGFQQQAQQKQQQIAQADQDFEVAQKAQLHNANMAMVNQNMTRNAFEMTRRQIEATEADAQSENDFNKTLNEHNHVDLGVSANGADLVQLQKSNPDLLKSHTQGQIYQHKEIKDGKVLGVHSYWLDPTFLERKNDTPVDIPMFTSGKDGGRPFYTNQTVPAGAHSMGEIALIKQAQEDKMSKADLDWANSKRQDANINSEIGLRGAQAVEARAAAGKNSAEAVKARQEAQNLSTAPGSPVSNTGMRLVEHLEDPSQISMRQKDRERNFDAADKYSMDKYGEHFDPAQAQTDYKFANNSGTRNTLNYVTSLVGADGKSGNLGTLRKLSAALPRTQFPALNDAQAWTRLQAGNPQVAAYHTAAVETADQFAKILQGGGSGSGTSDAKMKQGLEMFNKGFNNSQIQAVASTAADLLHERKKGIIGNNSYLLKDYAPDEYRTRQQSKVDRKNGVQTPPAQQQTPQGGGFNWGAHPVAQ